MEWFKKPMELIKYRKAEAEISLLALTLNENLDTNDQVKIVRAMDDKSSRTFRNHFIHLASQYPVLVDLFEAHLRYLKHLSKQLSQYAPRALTFGPVRQEVEQIVEKSIEPIFGLTKTYGMLLASYE
jgi:hypothetical protein